MHHIIQLDDLLANKIAAGEVVERPASVVKELVENAIDADSTVVEIEVVEAGLEKIRVIDNGTGISSEDVLLAFERHATSKIKSEHDLFRIRSLGFRGEALPSIASVAKLEVKTSTGSGAGTRVVLEGGKVVTTDKCSSRRGTDITVTDLFYNTPARLKYMRSLHTELGNITDVVNRLALAHPDVSLKLTHNGRRLLQTNGSGDARQVLAAIYGINIAKKMIPISTHSVDFEISGYISLPEVSRASRNYLSIMINGRFIKNYPIANAITEGYHTLLPIGRYPVVLLHIQMDPILVDVNVHPTKLEVRISKEKALKEIITETIQAAFKKRELIPSGVEPTSMATSRQQIEQTTLSFDHVAVDTDPTQQHQAHSVHQIADNEMERDTAVAQNERNACDDARDPETSQSHLESARMSEQIAEQRATDLFFDKSESLADVKYRENNERVPPLYPIGQMHGTYIFAQNERGLYMIDQHAAQERINYEFFREKVGQVTNEVQQLLVPLTLEYATDEWVKIEQYKSELAKVGVFLEPFGQHSYIVRAHPTWFPRGEEQETIEEMIEQLLHMKQVDIKKLREEAAIMMSCKAAIKANRHLRNDEIQALLDELRQTTDPFTCPHGRPIIIHYSIYEMEKMFKRVM